MKKLIYLLPLLLLAACSGSGAADTPEKAVENYCKAVKDCDIKAQAACCCNPDGSPVTLTPQQISDSQEIADQKKEVEKNRTYTVGGVQIDKEGHRATVEVEVTAPDTDPFTVTLTCLKGDDNLWRVLYPF